ncbi:type II toxin-antitoxin system VapC family toxin [Rhizobium leguminosarum]|uniref:PIN domain-containing protein n=1 Tax=Rhizobium leguminosarum TaxID=384 RepID=UPI000FEC981A|nr:PIN domain-containing protein [Rhizobium leguminosarum]RWX40263.1 type II toxin-antitoxin system VapC family toxin [Rhizobium leguminosarum]
MASKYILLDTNILSDAQKPRPRPELVAWLEGLSPSKVAIPYSALFEISYGIELVSQTDPERANKLRNWRAQFLSLDFAMPETTPEVGEIVAKMACKGPLKDHWIMWPDVNGAQRRKLKFGSDPMIAATAIAHQMPIATLNVRDFLLIDRYFPLPGIFDPLSMEWIVDPPPGWTFAPDQQPEVERKDHGTESPNIEAETPTCKIIRLRA